ncbi:P-loop containing nucleoside triphosphate hydrolase protein [Obelidium mucronatum]|nr:P-loop containing nucleoside triphosphate hydrolase protein [Obelidium mucronatum]
MFVRVCAKPRHFAAPRRLLATLSDGAPTPFAPLRPPPPPNPNPNPNSTPATLDSLSAIPTATVSAEAHKPALSLDQEKLLAAMTRGESVYFTGKAGAGKTEVLRRFIELCKGDITRKYRTQVTAPTGIAAAHITGGTLHSRFGLKVGVDPKRNDPKEIFNRCQHNTNLMARYILSKTVIIDEISMVHKREFDSISKAMSLLKSDLNSCSKVYDHMFAKLTTKGLSTEEVHQALGASDAGGLWDPDAISKPFGGAQVVLSGDFYQLPPIEKMSDEVIMYRQTITELYGSCPSESLEWHLSPYVFTSLEWKKLQEMCGMKTHVLGKSFRQTNQEFVAFLDRLRIGEWDKSMHGFLHSRLNNFGKEKKIRVRAILGVFDVSVFLFLCLVTAFPQKKTANQTMLIQTRSRSIQQLKTLPDQLKGIPFPQPRQCD